MSALADLGKAIERAVEECPTVDVLSIVTGAFVGLTIGVVRQNGHDAEKEITIEGERNITIHAKNKVKS